MKRLILALLTVLISNSTTKLEDIHPEQIIKISGSVEDTYIPWKLAPDLVIEQVSNNLTYSPNDPFTVYLGSIEMPSNAVELIKAQENSLEEAIEALVNKDEEEILRILDDVDKLKATALQKKIHNALANIEHSWLHKALHRTPSAKKVALKWPSIDCTPGEISCTMTLQRKCNRGFNLVNAGPVLFGKCRKLVEPTNNKCPRASEAILNRFNPEQLTCAAVENPLPCPEGFEAHNSLACKQTMKCADNQEMIMKHPNKGMCKDIS